MDALTLAWVRKTLGSVAAVKSMGGAIASLVARLCMLEQMRDMARVRALQAYVETVERMLATMQAHGASKAQLRSVMRELLMPRMRAYVDAAQAGEARLARHADGAAPQAERRAAPVVAAAVIFTRRAGDRKLH